MCPCGSAAQQMKPDIKCLCLNGCFCPLQQGKETQLLHVFEEDLILGSERPDSWQEMTDSSHCSGINKS